MIRQRISFFTCRLVIPLWLLAGAIYKLAERNPKLLPEPVFKIVQATDGVFFLSGTAWLDTAIRLIVLSEFVLVAVMLCMPRLARTVAVAVMTLFCVILLSIIVPEFQKGGFAQAWKGSCGCFGAGGPNPVIMLAIDFTLLLIALFSGMKPRGSSAPVRVGLPTCGLLCVIGLAVVCVVPNRAVIELEPLDHSPSPVVTPSDAVVNPSSISSTPQPQINTTNPSATVPSAASAWPGRPAQAQPYYFPEFAKWLGSRFDSQEIARLITPAPPESINTGTWFVIFYREDCDHCHALLQTYFSGPLKTPTLTIVIPDTDPAASMEMPCGECQNRKLVKGPDYVLTTPVLLKVVDGLVTDVVTDPEDRAAVERCLAP